MAERKELLLFPEGWPVPLKRCRPGLFTFPTGAGDGVGVFLLSEYGDCEAYCGTSGEIFWGGAKTKEERAELIVQPVSAEWQEAEE